MTARAARGVERLLATQHLRVVDIAPCWHGKILRIESHEIEDRIRRLGVAQSRLLTSWIGKARRLCRCAVAERLLHQRGRYPDVAGKSRSRLGADGRGAVLPTETAERDLTGRKILDPVGTPGNAIMVGVFGIRAGEDVFPGDGLDEAEADHRWRNARAQQDVRRQRPEAKVADAIMRFSERHYSTVAQADGSIGVGDRHLPFGLEAGNAEVLQLRAVGWLGNDVLLAARHQRLFRVGLCRHRNPQEHRYAVVGSAHRRMAAAVLEMAVLTTARVEQRPEPV